MEDCLRWALTNERTNVCDGRRHGVPVNLLPTRLWIVQLLQLHHHPFSTSRTPPCSRHKLTTCAKHLCLSGIWQGFLAKTSGRTKPRPSRSPVASDYQRSSKCRSRVQHFILERSQADVAGEILFWSRVCPPSLTLRCFLCDEACVPVRNDAPCAHPQPSDRPHCG